MPLIQDQVVARHGWLTLAEFADIVTIAEMTPGPIAINAATFVGTRVAGVAGAIVATPGCIAPSCIIVLTLAFYTTNTGPSRSIRECWEACAPQSWR